MERGRQREQGGPAGGTEVLLSKIPGGCGRELGVERSTGSEEGPIWCGLKSSSLEGYYFVCRDCK